MNIKSLESLEKKQIIINLSKQILYNSACQGLIKLFETRGLIIKVLWFFSLLVSIAICSFLVLQNFLEYFQYDVTTKIRKSKSQITEFPAVTICNKNFFTTDEALQFFINETEANRTENMFDIDGLYLKYKSKLKEHYKEIFKRYSSLFIIDNISLPNITKMGLQIDDVLIDCYFNGDFCNSSDFEWKHDQMLGNCFSFNSINESLNQRSKVVEHSGKQFGLTMTLFAGVNHQLKSLYPDYGIVIRIDNSTYEVASEEGISISTGFETDLAINDRVYAFRLPKPYSNCDIEAGSEKSFKSDSIWYNKMVENKINYNQEGCIDICIEDYFISKCNCSVYGYLKDSLQNIPCNTSEEYDCFDTATKHENEQIIDCYKTCPLECKEETYEISISQTRLAGDIYLSKFKNESKYLSSFPEQKLDAETLAHNLVRVNIYYDTLHYTEIIESPSITLVWLLSSIGGSLSLFLGLSVLSVVEMFEITIEILFLMGCTKTNEIKPFKS